MPRPAKEQKINQSKARNLKSAKLSPLKGPKETSLTEGRFWLYFYQLLDQMANVYGFSRVETAVLEPVNLAAVFKDKKNLVSFNARGSSDVCLRPDLRPGLMRLYYDQKLFNEPMLVKIFSAGDCYELDEDNIIRVKREVIFQFIGDVQSACEAQLILICFNICRDLSLPVQIYINSVGCAECRESYKNELIDYYRSQRHKLCTECKKIIARNPISIFNCPHQECRLATEEAPQILDWLCEACKDDFIKVLEYLDELEIVYNLNPRLVGEEWSEKTVFEIWVGPDEQEETSGNDANVFGQTKKLIASGGRFRNFLSKLSEHKVEASSIIFQIDKIISLLRKANQDEHIWLRPEIFVAQLGEAARRRAMVLFETLRQKGYKVAEAMCQSNLKAQLEYANKLGVKYSLIIGQKEVMDDTIMIRDMEGGIQEIIAADKIEEELKKKLSD